jgi:hypothetical protein
MQKRLVHILLTVLVFGYILFEELFWETIAKPIYKYIHGLKLLQKIETKIQHLPPWLLLLLFLSIFIVVEFVGLVAGVLAIQGNVLIATLLYLSKIPVAAFAFWLFRVSKNKLIQINWFHTAYNFTMKKIEWLKNTDVYLTVKEKAANFKIYIKEFKATYLPKGELKRRAKRIYIQLKKIFKKDIS